MRELVKAVVAYRDRRDWLQFHHPKDLAISIVLEAAELLEHFQWKTPEETARYLRARRNRDRVAAEMADLLILLISLADVLGEDLVAAARRKLRLNERKYPVARARGNARKYHALRARRP